MHISLTDRLDDYVREKVATGLYNNASEVIREALRLKIAAEETDEIKLQKLRDAIDPALAQAERGECIPFDMDVILTELDQDMSTNA